MNYKHLKPLHQLYGFPLTSTILSYLPISYMVWLPLVLLAFDCVLPLLGMSFLPCLSTEDPFYWFRKLESVFLHFNTSSPRVAGCDNSSFCSHCIQKIKTSTIMMNFNIEKHKVSQYLLSTSIYQCLYLELCII